jgi:hypothetical protein
LAPAQGGLQSIAHRANSGVPSTDRIIPEPHR